MQDVFFQNTPENQMKVIEMIRLYQPSIVLANAISDRHPDHAKGSELVSQACFYSGLKKIETDFEGEKQEAHRPKAVYHYIQDRHVKPDFVVDISEYAERKIQAIQAYSTQFFAPGRENVKTPISGSDFIDFVKGRMAHFGRDIASTAAEGFTVERTIGVSDMMNLV
jgi:bacillithiol biosynthesis deacetylase BshB1